MLAHNKNKQHPTIILKKEKKKQKQPLISSARG